MKTYVILLFLLSGFFNTQAQSSGMFNDKRDGQKYAWVKIGNQIWMAENLNYATGRGSGMYREFYGHFYDWKTANRVCPQGWHLPSDSEWKELERTLGMSTSDLNETYDRESGQVGLKLKSRRGWEFYIQNGNGLDEYGFNALPGGYYQTHNQKFMLYGSAISFWTSTSVDSENAISRDLRSESNGIYRNKMYKVHGAYCRCIKD